MKKTKKIFSFLITLCISSFLLTNCDNKEHPEPKGEYERGVFIINEGKFNGNDGEISYFNPSTKTVTNNIFTSTNEFTLGDVVQSMLIHEDNGYIVVNNSNKVEVVNANTFQSIGTITELLLPRYMVAQGNKGYVTEWVSFSSNGRVAIIDLNTNKVIKTLAVGNLPEQLIIADDNIFVANSADNTVSIIDVAAETVTNTIEAGNNPAYITLDKNGNVWVLSGFTTSNSTLVKFNPAIPATQTIFNFNASGASDLVTNGPKDKIYYSFNNAVYELDINATTLNNTPVINRNFYGIGVAPNEDILYGAFVPNFTSDGRIIRYNLTTGAALDSVNVSIAPNGFVFK